MHHDAGEAVERRLAGPALHRDELEAHEGEARLVGLDTAALQGVLQGLLGLAQVGGVEVALLIEHLGVAQGDRSSRPAR